MNMDNRNKRALVVCGAIVAAAVLYLAVIEPTFKTLDKLTDKLPSQEKKLKTMKELELAHEEIEAGLKDLSEKMAHRGKSFSLYSYLKSISPKDVEPVLNTQAGRPGSSKDFKETTVNAQMDGVSMEEVMQFLYKIRQADKLLRIDSMTITRSAKGKGGVKAVIIVSTLIPAK